VSVQVKPAVHDAPRAAKRARLALPAATAALLGSASVLGFAPFHVTPATILGVGGLYLLTSRAPSWRRAALLGWCFGLAFFIAGLHWIANSFLVEADRFGAFAAPAVLALSALLALFIGAACGLARAATGPRWSAAPAFAAAWTLAEFARGNVLSGFPWNLLGYVSSVSETSMQLASAVGVYGLSALTALAAAALGECLTPALSAKERMAAVMLAALAFAAPWAFGAWRLEHANTAAASEGPRLRIVQPNVPQAMKWRPEEREAILARYLELSGAPAAKPLEAVIWPETAVPFLIGQDEAVRRRIDDALPPSAALIAGSVRRDSGADAMFNSVLAFERDGRLGGTYDKARLVPFGEFIPLREFLPIPKLTQGTRDFASGPGPATLRLAALPPFQPLICYEAIFPHDIPAEKPQPQWLVNVTNDAWFGPSIGPQQHFQMARMRAVERGLPLIRAANTGVSAVIDPYGRIQATLALGERGVIDADLPPPAPSTLYADTGDAPLLAACVAALAWRGLRRRRIGR